MKQQSFNTLVLCLLGLSLILNLTLMSRIQGLNQTVQGLSGVSGQLHTLYASIEGVRSTLYQMEQEAAWHTRPSVEVQAVDRGGIEIGLSWDFREIADDAEVRVRFRGVDDEWREVEAERVSGATYQARLQLSPADVSTNFSLAVDYSVGPDSRVQFEESSGSRLDYVIVAHEQGAIRSGEQGTVDVSKVLGYFGGRLSSSESGELYGRVNRRGIVDVPIATIYLVTVGQAGELDRVELEVCPVEGPDSWSGTLVPEQPDLIREVGFVVVFEDGSEHARLTEFLR